MPSCYYCGTWYKDPNVDGQSYEEFCQWLKDGHDVNEFDCGSKEKHAEVDYWSDFQMNLVDPDP